MVNLWLWASKFMKRVITLSPYTWKEGGFIQRNKRYISKVALGNSYCVNKVNNSDKFALNACSMKTTLSRVMGSWKKEST
jgi:hypothetical protein